MRMIERNAGLYIHIPFCQKKCNYCDFPSYANMEGYWDVYSSAVTDELKIKSEEFNDLAINTIFIGGGTPSLLPEEYISKIFDTVYKNYKVPNSCEISIESNPGTLTSKKLSAYRNIGINRLSMGLQACQDSLLKLLGRIHTYGDFLNALNLAQMHGFNNINADIIFGIPGQTLTQWEKTVEQIIGLGLTHISCYSLMIEDGTVFGDMKEKGAIREIDDELDRDMYHHAVNSFLDAGYDQYEISNFAKPHYKCRHNMNYWERGEYIGIGAGAHSFIKNRRYANTQDVREYISGIKAKNPTLDEDSYLSPGESLAERMILGLRLNKGIDMKKVSEEYGVDVKGKYSKSLNSLKKQGLIEFNGSILKLTQKGLDFANRVFVEFM